MKKAVSIHAFILLLESYHPEKQPLSQELKEYLEKIVQERSYRKHHLLLHEEQVPVWSWFIIEGVVRVYYYDASSSRQETCWFWYPGEFMVSLRSSFRQQQAGEYLQLLTDTKLLAISMYDLQILVLRFPEYRLIERAIIEAYQCRIDDYNRIVTANINERFARLHPAHRAIFGLTNLTNIASFMKMHRSTLSYYRALHLNDSE